MRKSNILLPEISVQRGIYLQKRSYRVIGILWLAMFILFSGCDRQGSEPIGIEKEQGKLNILMLLADDLGYGDLSCYGSPSVYTPNLDRLANEGTRYTQFYAGSAVCTPSRACLLTGQFPCRFNILGHFKDDTEFLPDTATTIPKVLKQAGYYTAHVGKWHLGGVGPDVADNRENNFQPGPAQHGFDDYVVMDEGPTSMRKTMVMESTMYREGAKHYRHNDRKLPPSDKFLTDYQADWAIDLISEVSENTPFYMQVWFDAPHTPYEPAPGPALEKYRQLGASGDQLLWRSMVENLDHNIGRILDYLDRTGLSNQTLVVFTSDNGPAYQGSPGPFKGGKTDIHEGGIRVPLIVRWPGLVSTNRVSTQLSHMADFLPTFTGLSGVQVDLKTIDGIDLMPHWKYGEVLDHKPMFWQIIKYSQYQNQGPRPLPHATTAVLDGHWKLLGDGLSSTELFDLSNDHRELYNELDNKPGIKQKLEAKLKENL
jgi:arylsulfatase A